MKKSRLFLVTFLPFILLLGCEKKSLTCTTGEVDEILPLAPQEVKAAAEDAYLQETGESMIWCMPEEKNSFDTSDELSKYVSSQFGWRCYWASERKCLFLHFDYPNPFESVYELNCEGLGCPILDYRSVWHSGWSGAMAVYCDGKFQLSRWTPFDYRPSSDLSPWFSQKEALEIKWRHEAYLQHYFGRFMIEGETDYDQAYFRISSDLR